MAKKLVIILTIAASSLVFGQGQNNLPGQKGGLEDISLEKFERAEDWRALATCPLGETKTLKTVQKGEMTDVFDQNIKPSQDELAQGGVPNYILGVKTYFCDKGFDRVEISPPHEYELKGKPRQLSVWVLGRNYRHTIYVKLRDYQGTIHKIRLGRLNFFGWRRLTVTIPGWIPQSDRFALQDKKLNFVSLYVVADEYDVRGQFYFYVDNLRYKTDSSGASYPGSEIKDNW